MNYPINKVRNYFGEQIGFYFAFSRHYTNFLMYLTFLAIPLQIYTYLSGNSSGPIFAVFAAGIIIWGCLMSNLWTYEQSKCAIKWGVTDFESKEKIRPEFQDQGDPDDESEDEPVEAEKPGPLTDLYYLFFGGVKRVMSPLDRNTYDYVVISEGNKKIRNYVSLIVSLSLQGFIIFCTTQVYALQSYIEHSEGPLQPFSKYIATGLNVVQSMLFEQIHSFVADILGAFENHRTTTDYENAAILKKAMFTFINAYVSFFYLAFVAGNQIMVLFGEPLASTTTCAGYSTCLVALQFNINAILISNLVAQNAAEFPLWAWATEIFSEWWLGETANGAKALEHHHPHKQWGNFIILH